MPMNPSDTHLDRMAETFAERTPYLRETREEREQAWKKALELGRDEGILTQIESHMKAKGRVDKVAEDTWERAREYPEAAVSAEEAPVLRPYMALGGLLGSFLGQVKAEDVSSVTIELDGKAAALNPEPVAASTLAGLLGPVMESVNMVNAAGVASANGIAVSTVRHDRQCDYETLLRVTIGH